MPSQGPAAELVRYLAALLGEAVTVMEATVARRLPLALRQRYTFWAAICLDRPCLFLIARSSALDAPDTLAKQVALVRTVWSDPIALVADTITPHLRRRLLAQRMPFVIPGAQCFLPFLGLALTERFGKSAVAPTHVRPATQATLLWWIHHGLNGADTARDLSRHLGYTPMSLSRVFDELEHLATTRPALTVARIGRERKANWTGDAHALWDAVRPSLRDPVVRRQVVHVPIDQVHDIGYSAGLTGLGMLSDLAPPATPVVAIAHAAWQEYTQRHCLEPGLLGEGDAIQVEVWCHAPNLHQHTSGPRPATADPLAMSMAIAGTQDASDDRVASALQQMITEHGWRW